MSQQIRFFQLPFSDITNENCTVTIVDTVAEDSGQLIADFMRNRNLTSAWLTTGSNDSANTEIIFDFSDSHRVDSVFLVDHNLKDFGVYWFDGFVWILVDDVIGNTSATTEHRIGFDGVKKVKVIAYKTMVANDDKRITRFLAMEQIGQLNGWPEISGAQHDLGQKLNKMLSGKYSVSESVGSFSFDLSLDLENDQADIDIYEQILFLYRRGVIVYLCGGDEDQFAVKALGYRASDFYYMRPERDYKPDFYKSLYSTGIKLKISFVEVV